jgi:hypothetical protein
MWKAEWNWAADFGIVWGGIGDEDWIKSLQRDWEDEKN